MLRTLVKEPLKKFKKATEELKYHESTKYHKFSVEKAVLFMKTMENNTATKNIAVVLDKKKAELIEGNRKRLRPIIKTIIFCARNNLPLRGHRDDGYYDVSSDKQEQDLLTGRMGVFRSLLAFRIDSGDDDLKSHLSSANRNSTMISKTIQNEVVGCISDVLRCDIVESVKKAKFFSILCDETTDSSTKEQLTFCLRYFDMEECTPKEEFLGFVELKSTTSSAIKSAIDDEMKLLGLSYDYLCGQGYDGGSNMAGHISGVQALISEEQPTAIYTHCFSHRLNLCITRSCDIPAIRNMMGIVSSVSAFFSTSALRSNALAEEIGKSNIAESKKQRLKTLCPTRWVERHDCLLTFKELVVPVVNVLEAIGNSTTNADASSKAYMLSSAVKRSEFIVGLESASYCLGFTVRLSETLQSPKQDLSSAYYNVRNVLESIKNIRREADLEFGSIFENSLKVAEELGCDISIPRTCKKQTTRENTPAGNPEEYFKRTIFLPLVDHIIVQIEARFNEKFASILPLEGLIPTNLSKYTDNEIIKASQLYDKFINETSSDLMLKSELTLWRNKWKEEAKLPENVAETLKQLNPSFFPTLKILIQIFGTIPVSTATPERSFSTLKRIKTYLRSTMGESRLNGLALANIAKDREINVEKVIDLFSKKKPRRMAMENWNES